MEADLSVVIVGGSPTPGPADYLPRLSFGGGPRFSMRARPAPAGPAPSAGYVTLKGTVGTGVRHSLSSRPPQPKVPVSPGPGYVPPAFGSNARGCGFFRAKPQKVQATPGPADYYITPGALHAFGENSPRTAFRDGGRSPGPANSNPRFRSKKRSPRWTKKGRLE
jgi:hypothetical protein